MITSKVIKGIYKRCRKSPIPIENIDFSTFFGNDENHHGLRIVDGKLIIESIDNNSPFHSIDLKRIIGVLNFELNVAIVLPKAIVFLSKESERVQIHLDLEHPSLWQRIKNRFWNR